MKFKIDENVPIEIIDLLNRHNYNAHSVYHEGIAGCSDSEIAAICKKEQRILITLDLDFSDIRKYPPSTTNGIMILRLNRQDKHTIMKMMENVLPLLKQEKIKHTLMIVEKNKIRIRE